MRVSVVIPVLDAEAFLAQTLRSVLRQTRPPHEVIVVDNGSTDASLAIARGFGPRVRTLEVPAEGASAARNAGAAQAAGDAIMFMDADDLLGPTVLEELTAVLADAPGAIACCAWMRYELVGETWIAVPQSCAPKRVGQDDLAAWLTGWYHPPCALLWSRAAYEASGGWDPAVRVNTDGDVMMRALVAGVPLVRTAGGVSYYRRLPGEAVSLSGKRRTAIGLSSRLDVIDGIAGRLERAGRLGRYRAPLAAAYENLAADAEGLHPELEVRARASAARVGGAARGALARRAPARSDLSLPTRPAVARRVPAPDLASSAEAEPLVSVVVPTYQRGPLVERALRSVLAQSYRRFEILVVDDGSTDDTAARIAALGDPRIRLLRQAQNGGVARARNRGMREAEGSLIAFLDSDDEWEPGKLAAQVALAARRPPEVGLFYTGVLEYGAGGDRIVKPATLRGDLWREFLHRNPITSASGIVVRREVMETVGLFDPSFPAVEDWEYWTRIARFYEVDCVPEPLTIYHDEETAEDASSARRSRSFEANMTARRMFAQRYLLDAEREGVRHLLLLETARRHLRSPFGDRRAAFRSLARAVLLRPTEPRLYAWLAFSGLPRGARDGLGPGITKARARLPERVWFGTGASGGSAGRDPGRRGV